MYVPLDLLLYVCISFLIIHGIKGPNGYFRKVAIVPGSSSLWRNRQVFFIGVEKQLPPDRPDKLDTRVRVGIKIKTSVVAAPVSRQNVLADASLSVALACALWGPQVALWSKKGPAASAFFPSSHYFCYYRTLSRPLTIL